MASLQAEEKAFRGEVKAVEQWWTDGRWRYTRRPFSSEQIVSKRGNIKIEYPGNVQSKKLWKILESRFQVRYQLFVVLLCKAEDKNFHYITKE